jgi:hypothetical protein
MSAKTLDLRNLTPEARNAALNEAMAVVAGLTVATSISDPADGRYWPPALATQRRLRWASSCSVPYIPPYATSCDAVMPLLEQYSVMVERVCYEDWEVRLDPSDAPDDGSDYTQRATGDTFPIATCIALLRAHGWEVLT